MQPLVTVTSNIADVMKRVRKVPERVINVSNAKALTFAAEAGQKAIRDTEREVFDRPTEYTLNATYIKPATVNDPVAAVYLKRFSGVPADRYLLPEIEGGTRHQKSTERQLAPLMRGFRFVVPADLVKRDGYGNVPGNVFMQILSQLKVATDGYQNQTATSKRRGERKRNGWGNYFIPPVGSRLKPGVYQRMGRNIAPVLLFTERVHYKKRLDFYGVGMAAARAAYPIKFEEQVDREMKRLLNG